MRIALCAWESLYSVTLGGVGVHVSSVAGALRRLGHEVHVFTRLGEGQRLFDNIFGVLYHRCPYESRPDFIEEMGLFCESMLHYIRAAETKTGCFDRIHCHDWMAMRTGLALHAERGTPLAVTFHTTEWGRSGSWPEGPAAKRIAEIERNAVQAADTVIAVSQSVRREMETLYRCPDWKKAVITHGVDLAPFAHIPFDAGAVKGQIGLGPLDPTLLVVGRLHHHKGQDLLLGALPAVRERFPEVRAVFVGEGDLRAHLEHEVERLGVRENVCFLGVRSGRALIDLYRAADLVVSPSRQDPFGVVTLSAWAAGVPILATDLGVPHEIVKHQDTGFLVPPEVAAMGRGILEAFSDFELLRWVGQNGRIAAETAFTWDSVAERTEAAYRRARRVLEVARDPARS